MVTAEVGFPTAELVDGVVKDTAKVTRPVLKKN